MLEKPIYFEVAGLRFDNRESLALRLDARSKLRLKAEPNNPHDSNAIAVLIEPLDLHLGYVPRYLSKIMAPYAREQGLDLPKIELMEVTRDELRRVIVRIAIIVEVNVWEL